MPASNSRRASLAALLWLVGAALWAQDWAGSASLGLEVSARKGGTIDGARVLLTPVGAASESGPPPAATDDRGRAVFTGLATGVWRVRVDHPDFLSWVGMVELRRGKKPRVTASFLEAGGTSLTPIRVKLSDAGGRPASPPLEPRGPVATARSEPPAPAGPPAAVEPAPRVAESPAKAPVEDPVEAPVEGPAESLPAPSPGPEPEPAPQAPPDVPAEAALPEPELVEAPKPAPVPPPAAAPPTPEVPAPEAPEPKALEPEAPESGISAPGPPESDEIAADEPPTEGPGGERPEGTPIPTAPALPEPQTPPEPAIDVPSEAAPQVPAPAETPEPAPVPAPAPVPTPAEAPPQAEAPQPAEALPAPAPPAEAAPSPTAPPPTVPSPTRPSPSGPPPIGPSIRSFRDGSCTECRSGEWSASAEVVAAPAPSGEATACPRRMSAAGERAAQLLGEAGELELRSFAGPALSVESPDARPLLEDTPRDEIENLLDPAADASCRWVGVVLPKGARFIGFRFEAADASHLGDCLPNRECAIGRCTWASAPRVERGASATVVHALFVNQASDRPRRGRLTAYFLPPRAGWSPPR